MSTNLSSENSDSQDLLEPRRRHITRRSLLKASGATALLAAGADTLAGVVSAHKAEQTRIRHISSENIGKSVTHLAFTGFDKTADQIQGHLEAVLLPHGDVDIVEYGQDASAEHIAKMYSDSIKEVIEDENPAIVLYGQSMGGIVAAHVAVHLEATHNIPVALWLPDCTPGSIANVRNNRVVSMIGDFEPIRYMGPGARRMVEAGFEGSKQDLGYEQLRAVVDAARVSGDGLATPVVQWQATQILRAKPNFERVKQTLMTIPGAYLAPEDPRKDWYVDTRQAYQTLRTYNPSMTLHEIEGGSHCVHTATRDEYAEVITGIYEARALIDRSYNSSERRAV